jgi:hypothetical protein
VRTRDILLCASAVCTLWLSACGINDRTLRERTGDSGIERGQDGGAGDGKGGNGGKGGDNGSRGGTGAGGEDGAGTGPGSGGQPCDPQCADPTPPSCSDCPPARVAGALIGVSGAPRAPAGVRLREHGFEPRARSCAAVGDRVLCVSGGIGP